MKLLSVDASKHLVLRTSQPFYESVEQSFEIRNISVSIICDAATNQSIY